ncbi:translation factor [Anaeramoeba flamelloides]|uniref:Translation factor n=1 Tax=Anaeramoeba flamelloides TaxID=1746091 RepID=A0ABQ8YE76_9EUKA|nr:translation factor [Anaeramoeba flamelloides]
MNELVKQSVAIAFIGYSKSGKSTICGHFLYQMGDLDEKQLEKYELLANQINQGSSKYAWHFDKLKLERERGHSVNWNVRHYQNDNIELNLLDTPGRRHYIKNRLTALSQADVAVLVVDPLGYKDHLTEGTLAEHLLICRAFGIEQIIVLVNKMDDEDVQYSETIFCETKTDLIKLLKQAKYNPKKVSIIPTSGWEGENLVAKTKKMGWWKGQTLNEKLSSLRIKRKMDLPLRIPILDVYRISGVGSVAVGKIATGQVSEGQQIAIAPIGVVPNIKTIERYYKNYKNGECGSLIGINIKGVGLKLAKKGLMIGDPKNDPPCQITQFTAQITLVNLQMRKKVGYCPVIDCHTSHIPCKLFRIVSKIDPKTKEVIEKSPKYLVNQDTVVVIFKPIVPMSAETFYKYPKLGRILVRNNNIIEATGFIISTIKKDSDSQN